MPTGVLVLTAPDVLGQYRDQGLRNVTLQKAHPPCCPQGSSEGSGDDSQKSFPWFLASSKTQFCRFFCISLSKYKLTCLKCTPFPTTSTSYCTLQSSQSALSTSPCISISPECSPLVLALAQTSKRMDVPSGLFFRNLFSGAHVTC